MHADIKETDVYSKKRTVEVNASFIFLSSVVFYDLQTT
jgi:hypothetical protein